jgi:hypothetical protein
MIIESCRRPKRKTKIDIWVEYSRWPDENKKTNFWDMVHIDNTLFCGTTKGIEGRLMLGHAIGVLFCIV